MTHLKEGSLVGLSSNNFQTIAFAIVTRRDVNNLEKGKSLPYSVTTHHRMHLS